MTKDQVIVSEATTAVDDTQSIPVITEEMMEAARKTPERLMEEAEHRHHEQVKASTAIFGVEKVKILLTPLMRDAIFTDDEMKAVVALHSILESAQRRLDGAYSDNVPMLELPTVPRGPLREFDWADEGK